jgi:CheY-like chemotaxis protein
MSDTLRVLLVEDNPGDARLVQELLTDAPSEYAITHAPTLAAAIQALQADTFDLALVDLHLPDADGLATVDRIREPAPALPVVVLTGLEDTSVGLEAVRHGAQDYLRKGTFDDDLLHRTVRYAVERAGLQRALLQKERAEALRQERAVRRLAALSDGTLGAPLLHGEADPYEALTQRYAQALGSLAAQAAPRDPGGLPEDVQQTLTAVAEEVGHQMGGPKDLVELHTRAMERRIREAPEEKSRLMEEGPDLLASVLALLAGHYRTQLLSSGA